jgi:hypothetical protein
MAVIIVKTPCPTSGSGGTDTETRDWSSPGFTYDRIGEGAYRTTEQRIIEALAAVPEDQ